MPIYEYVCEKCGAEKDVIQKISDPAPSKCESCGAKKSMVKQLSRTSFVLKGGGWYKDLYGSAKPDTKTSESTTATETKSSDDKKPQASETKTETKAAEPEKKTKTPKSSAKKKSK